MKYPSYLSKSIVVAALFLSQLPLSWANGSNESKSERCFGLLAGLTRARQVAAYLVFGGDTRVERGSRTKLMEDAAGYYLHLPKNAISQVKGLVVGLAQVADLMRIRPLPAKMIPPDHPWVTGLNPQTGKPIWQDNVLYSSESKFTELHDDQILFSVGRFLTGMVKKSVAEVEIPLGEKRRMPHLINYIHGTSHYNSAIIILNDNQDGFMHFSDSRFRDDLMRFINQEKREVLIYFRDQNYDLQEYTYFTAYVRATLPWFANSDGPRKNILWGNTAPYPVVNILTGDWARDIYSLKKLYDNKEEVYSVAHPPIKKEGYFSQGPYNNGLRLAGSRWPERVIAIYTYYRVKLRGERGNHSTLDRREVDKPGSDNYQISHFLRSEIEKRDDQKK